MGRRKHISYRTLYAMALLALGRIPYEHAKAMGESNFLSLWMKDHNIYVEANDPDQDEFWNLTPMLIAEHREKTKRDMKIIAKGRRIRAKFPALAPLLTRTAALRALGNTQPPSENPVVRMADALADGWREGCRRAYERIEKEERKKEERKRKRRISRLLEISGLTKRKLRSRGFDKTRRRKMSGKVVPR